MKFDVLILASGLSGMAQAAAVNTTTSAVPSPTEPCAVASAAYASQIAVSPSATPTVAADIAHECLLSVPLGKEAAIELVDSIEPYLEWQSDSAYLADPPADYFYPAYDMFANLATIRTKLESDGYAGEYEFQAELYNTVFGPAHDGHFVYYPDLLTLVFDWNRPLSLVSISEDQSSLPEIKVYQDVISSPSNASTVTLINGIDAATYLGDTINQAGWNQDVDSAYNSMFFELSAPAAGLGVGYFQGGGRIRYIYHGDNTNITFANGTEITLENYARIKVPLTGITDGESMYETFCNPNGYDSGAAATSVTNATSATLASIPGYPTPVVITNDAIVAGFYLDGEGYEDVAVIVLLAFESESPAEFQAVASKFFADAVAAGKTKLVIDFQGNGGGYILQGYDFFRQLFPQVQEDGFSRWKDSDSFLAISDVVSTLVAKIDPYTSDDETLIGYYESWFNYRYDLNLTLDPFLTFEDKFGPVVYQDTNYTDIMRWNLNDNLTTTNETFGLGIEISGYGTLANLTQPFAAENIVMLYDGVCASTCTLASEMLRIQGGVKSVAMGGRPQEGPIQGVGGVKGAQVLDWGTVLAFNQFALQDGANITDDAQKAALERYTDLAVNRSTAAAINGRDQILRDNVEDGLPAQFVAEEADCRLYWTLPMITDITAVWKAVADSAWNGATCAYGSISTSSSGTASKRNAGDVAGGRIARPIQRHPTRISRRELSQPESVKAKHILKAIP
ncbi:peptidase s41 family protein [Diaporthe amygdali]|uniref:peptidase s41 family protein n=1 Tax=Phomopsis amygdali TaxID=1214568 RepID=UPI0022FE6C5C|nr:peptidase s41 family protein [Diaporthe amygdali]KAJ0114988.1 peptidase s41 family protein [Diaporthe amygdali]